jgi:lipoprotein NlpD
MSGRAAPPLRAIAALLMLALVAACAQTTVVRTAPRGKPQTVRPVAPPKPGATAVVRKGDTVYRIATRHGVSPLDLAVWNRIPPPYTIYPGQRLRLTPPAARRLEPPRSAGTKPDPPRVVGPSPTTRPPTGTRPPPSTTPPVATPPAPRPAPPPTAAAFDWRWPADGTLVGRFVAGDPTRQGIGIAGKSGAPVRAAADGVVVYSGAGLIGYGELIIVKHDEQWLSAYGHNRARLVNEGQRVKAGDQIAEMGRSGASRDMLHFEIRFNGKPQDPLQALPKR